MRKSAALAAVGAVVALLTSACGSATSSDGASGNALHDRLPETVRSAGELKIGGAATVAPYLYKDGSKVVGFERELMAALGKELDIKIKFSDTGFDALVPALQSRKIDVGMGDFTDTKERQQAIDFVDYTRSYQTLFVGKGNPKNLGSLDDLCGTTVASTVGSLSNELAEKQDATCRDAGKPGVKVMRLKDNPATMMQVRTGRADAVIIDFVIGRYVAEQSKQGEVVGDLFYKQFHGAAVRKGNDELRDVLVDAFTKIMKNGTYGKILKKWDVEKTAMPAPKVNAAKV